MAVIGAGRLSRPRAEPPAALYFNPELTTDAEGKATIQFTMPPADVMHVLRLLTFSASHHQIADGRLLTPAQIVDVVLDGVLTKDA